VKHSKKPMFEKMILHPDLTTEAPREDVEIETLWGTKGRSINRSGHAIDVSLRLPSMKEYYARIKDDDSEDEDEMDCDDEEIFPSLCECHQNFVRLYESSDKASLMYQKSMEMRINAVFCLGIFLGCVTGSLLFSIISLIRKKCEAANKKQAERQTTRERFVVRKFLFSN